MCERRHYYSYGLEIEPKATSDALYRGNCGHSGLEMYYVQRQNGATHDDAVDAALTAAEYEGRKYEIYERDKLDFQVARLLLDYFDMYKDDQFETLAVELQIEVELTDETTIPIVIDWIARMKGVGIVVWDHKFQADFFNPESIDLNPQLPKYLAALKVAGYYAQKAGYNEIRTRDTIEIKNDPSKRFRRTLVPLSPNRVTTTMREHLLAARRINRLKELGVDVWEKSVLRVANKMTCSSCSFKTICASDLEGYDPSLIIAYDFKHKENRRANRTTVDAESSIIDATNGGPIPEIPSNALRELGGRQDSSSNGVSPEDHPS